MGCSSSGSKTSDRKSDIHIDMLCKVQECIEHSVDKPSSFAIRRQQQRAQIPSIGSLQNRKIYHRMLLGRVDRMGFTKDTYEDERSLDLVKERADPDFDPSLTLDEDQFFNWRGCSNGLVLAAAVSVLLGLFLALPVGLSVSKYMDYAQNGQSPMLVKPGGRLLIDPDTPIHERTRTSMEGETWHLVFSDEFNTPGRTFYPGEDPFWEAVDLHYWATKDYEWYSPDMIRTVHPGYLQITMEKRRTHNLDYVSGMLQSWDKVCFTGGMLEVNVSLPGPPNIPGFWPGVWMLGNLARAGYGASTDGVWPYSYDSCDAGVTRNQSRLMKSYLPGQRLNRCTCPSHIDKTEHPSPGRGRGAPEIDVLEATGADDKFGDTAHGSVSQSVQFAPFDDWWQPNTSGYEILNERARTIGHNGRTIMNPYRGSEWQQAVSALTQLDTQVYEGRKFQTYAVEYVPSNTKGKKPYIRWLVDGKETWRMYEDAVGPNSKTKIGQRLISMEPMSLILNFGMSSAFGPVDTDSLPFPSHFLIDYVRYYQSPDRISIDCSPPDFPTAEYIRSHYNAYTNPNLTTFAEAGYSFPPFTVKGHCS